MIPALPRRAVGSVSECRCHQMRVYYPHLKEPLTTYGTTEHCLRIAGLEKMVLTQMNYLNYIVLSKTKQYNETEENIQLLLPALLKLNHFCFW